MTICDLLDCKVDERKDGTDCTFNGYLEDYLSLDEDIDESIKAALEKILSLNPSVKIIVNLRDSVNSEAVSNIIIMYRDIYKLVGKPVVYPYVLYVDGKALGLVPYGSDSGIFAKAMFYCMTEQGGEYIDYRNDIVFCSSDNSDIYVKAFKELFKRKASGVQKSCDMPWFKNYDDLKAKAIDASKRLVKEAHEVLPKEEDRMDLIYDYVIQWFLLKKILYVQYMVNKDILKIVHKGDVRAQRHQAKLYSEMVQFISYSNLWRMGE